MGFFSKMSEPLFLKESSSAEEQLEKLKALMPLLNEEGQAKLRQDIKYMEAGIFGEKNIIFELKNSHMPMYIIRDLYLKDKDLTSQIDFLVVTRKICFVIECKNLYGNIEIDNQGTFVRTIEFGRQKREGIYSPITQNQRHLALIRKLRIEQAKGFLGRFFREKNFEEVHRSVVVLANPRTVLNARYAKKEVKNQVIRADQLVDFIKQVYSESKAAELNDRELLAWAQSYLDMDQENDTDYLKKYESYKVKKGNNRGNLIKNLRSYRWNTSQAEGIKPYFIFNDRQMMDLIDKFPVNIQELRTVSGFGDVKIEKYGVEIIAILDRYRN